AKTDRDGVEGNPGDDERGLPGDVPWRSEEPRGSLGPATEGVVTEGARHVRHERRFGPARAAPARPRPVVGSFFGDARGRTARRAAATRAGSVACRSAGGA